MKTLKYFMGALVLGAFVMTGCKKKDPVVVPVDPTPGVEKEEAPALAAPGEGKVTVAIRVPEGTCNGAYAVGTVNGWKEKDATLSFVAVEGTEHWLSLTLDYAADMQFKVLAKPEDEALYGWTFQWGMNTDDKENVTIVAGTAEIALENGGQPKLTGLAENSVLYVDIDAWASAPCQERNAAGKATWKVTVPASTPETAVLSVVGGWGVEGDEDYWAPGAVKMERQADGTYTLEREVPAAFQYKYVVSADGTAWSWDYAAVPNENRDMPVSLSVVETIESWTQEPWDAEPVEYNEAGTVKFTITVENYEPAAGDKVILTGNFAEKAWGDSDRAMTLEGGKYIWEGAVPANFEFKVFVQPAEGDAKWASGNNVKLLKDLSNATTTFTIG